MSSTACISQPSQSTKSADDTINRADAGSCTPDEHEPICGISGPRCPQGTTGGWLDGCWSWYCIPDFACSTDADPGTCGGPVECQITGPECPAGTKAGVIDGCWSGFCIPDFACGSGSGSGSGSGGGSGSGSGGGSGSGSSGSGSGI